MVDTPISGLDPANTLNGSELVPVTQGSDTVRTTAADIAALSQSDFNGGTLTQDLFLNGDPTADLGAATKQYVDSIDADTRQYVDGKQGLDITSYGAEAEGSSSATVTAIEAMAADVGYVLIPQGQFNCDDVTILVPLFFAVGGSLNVGAGQTITIRSTVHSAKQYIFRGTSQGSYEFGHITDLEQSEASRQFHIAWWGIFSFPGTTSDQGPAIETALLSMQNIRESNVQFDKGNYTIESEVAVPRGCHMKGLGTRRTTFRTTTPDRTIFRTIGVAVKFSDLQFEYYGDTERTEPWIRLDTNFCEIYDVDCHGGRRNFALLGDSIRVDNIRSSWDAYKPTWSSLIEIDGGQGIRVSNLMANSSGDGGPETMVMVGGLYQSDNVSNVIIENVSHLSPARSVGLFARGGNIRRISIKNIINTSFQGTTDQVIRLQSEGAYDISSVLIRDVITSGIPTNGVVIQQSSTGTTEDVIISGLIKEGSAGTGVSINRSTGAIDSVHIGADCLYAGNTAITTSGTNITNATTAAKVAV